MVERLRIGEKFDYKAVIQGNWEREVSEVMRLFCI